MIYLFIYLCSGRNRRRKHKKNIFAGVNLWGDAFSTLSALQ